MKDMVKFSDPQHQKPEIFCLNQRKLEEDEKEEEREGKAKEAERAEAARRKQEMKVMKAKKKHFLQKKPP